MKLVNTLLDFSRIEARRITATFQATDLGDYTAELASNFRSALDKAGLRLTINTAPLPQPVYVDRDMWEKIVLNLLSNAFKFKRQFFFGKKQRIRRFGQRAVSKQLVFRSRSLANLLRPHPIT